MDLNLYLDSPGGLSAAELARQIKASPAFVYQWRRKIRPVPAGFCAAIERATNGAVSRKELRPDDWQAIWPDLQEGAGSK